jgi:non-ribosomal peptide synthetase-like protein
MPRVLAALLRVATFLYQIVISLLIGVALVPALYLVVAAWRTGSLVLTALALGLAYFLSGLTFLLLIVVIKHLLLFRAREGDYPFISGYTIRWATIGTLVGLAKVFILNSLLGSPVLNLFYRLMGARIGRNVVINTCNMFDFDLIEIGDDTMIGGDSVVIGHVGEGDTLRLRPIRIGRRCTVGQSAVVFPGAVMEDGSVLGALSLLPKGRVLPAGTRWGGNPLVELDHRPEAGAPPSRGEKTP